MAPSDGSRRRGSRLEGRRCASLLWAAATLSLCSCVEPLKESDRPCPCTGAWACSWLYSPKICVPREQACKAPPTLPIASETVVANDAASCAASLDGGQVTLIDDFESQDLEIHRGGVNGKWFASNDHSGGCGTDPPEIAPAPGQRCGSRYAMRLTETGLTDWGADVGFALNSDGEHNRPFDTTPYKGIQFWAKSGSIPFQFQFKLVDVTGDPAGMKCAVDAGPTDPRACYVPFLRERTVDTEWAPYQFPFMGAKPHLDQVYELLWGIPTKDNPGDWQQYILWIDDVAWYR